MAFARFWYTLWQCWEHEADDSSVTSGDIGGGGGVGVCVAVVVVQFWKREF
jgi:hypothetical protein